MKQKIRGWKIQLKVNHTLKDIGAMINTVVQGWINYYTHYYKSEFYEVLRYINLNTAAGKPKPKTEPGERTGAAQHAGVVLTDKDSIMM